MSIIMQRSLTKIQSTLHKLENFYNSERETVKWFVAKPCLIPKRLILSNILWGCILVHNIEEMQN